jgi:hypothetical protein
VAPGVPNDTPAVIIKRRAVSVASHATPARLAWATIALIPTAKTLGFSCRYAFLEAGGIRFLIGVSSRRRGGRLKAIEINTEIVRTRRCFTCTWRGMNTPGFQ